MESCYFQPCYAGEDSKKFWKEVGRGDRTLYDFACALQDMESRVLAVVNTIVRAKARKAIIAGRKPKRRPGA